MYQLCVTICFKDYAKSVYINHNNFIKFVLTLVLIRQEVAVAMVFKIPL